MASFPFNSTTPISALAESRHGALHVPEDAWIASGSYRVIRTAFSNLTVWCLQILNRIDVCLLLPLLRHQQVRPQVTTPPDIHGSERSSCRLGQGVLSIQMP